MTPKTIYIALGVILVLFAFGFEGNYYIRNILTYGWDVAPTHSPNEDCIWIKKKFVKKGITFFQQDCPDRNPWWVTTENQDGSVVETIASAPNAKFTIQILPKNSKETPQEVMEKWFSDLTEEQQQNCNIQNGDEPIRQFVNGASYWTEEPHAVPHKQRFKIVVKQEIVDEIINKYSGIPDDSKFDFMCGHIVGSEFTTYSPYFEFDDRSPEKYLFVGARGQDAQAIDLNSIRF